MRHRYKDRACRNELSCSWRLGTRDSKATTNYYVQISTLPVLRWVTPTTEPQCLGSSSLRSNLCTMSYMIYRQKIHHSDNNQPQPLPALDRDEGSLVSSLIAKNICLHPHELVKAYFCCLLLLLQWIRVHLYGLWNGFAVCILIHILINRMTGAIWLVAHLLSFLEQH